MNPFISIVFIFLFAIVICLPINDEENGESTNVIQEDPKIGEQKAGILDALKPSKKPIEEEKEENNNPFAGIQNFFSNLNILNNTSNKNPFQSLFSNIFNDAKLFMTTTQGIVMPVGSIANGFGNMFQGLFNLPGLSG